MPIEPEARRRLAEQMERRRIHLQMKWTDVARAGSISYETLRDVRNGTSGEMRELTKRGIEVGLQWQSGTVDCILKGGAAPPGDDPVLCDDFERHVWSQEWPEQERWDLIERHRQAARPASRGATGTG